MEQEEQRGAHPLVVALTAAVDLVVQATQDDASGLGGFVGPEATEVLLGVCEQVSRLQVASARLSTSVADDGLWAIDAGRSFVHWLAARTGMSYPKARDLVATGRALRDHLPVTAAAGLAGEISSEQVATLARLAPTSEARQQVLAAPAEQCGEAFLVQQARECSADELKRLVKRWAAAADPEADERGYREAQEREFLMLASTLGGYHVQGFLTTERGALFGTALDSLMTPPAPGDTRTTQQRRAQAVGDLSRLVLDHGLVGTGAAVRPHLSVVVDYDTLTRAVGAADEQPAGNEQLAGNGHRQPAGAGSGLALAGTGCRFHLAPVADVERFAVGEILGAGPIPPSVLARLACDSELNRVIFGPDSQVIDAGRAERTYSGPRRKAVIARDGTCRWPGCTAPPALGEIHHVQQWARDHGDTDINTGILLCWYHHDVVHSLRIEIRRSPTGGWLFLTRHGQPVTTAV